MKTRSSSVPGSTLQGSETIDSEVGGIFRQAQEISAEADQPLVDADWARPSPAAETLVAALMSHDDQPIVEMVLCSSQDGQDADQQTLFSWAEFLADTPVQPESRGRRQRPLGPSLFDWVLECEQEAGLVAAGGQSVWVEEEAIVDLAMASCSRVCVGSSAFNGLRRTGLRQSAAARRGPAGSRDPAPCSRRAQNLGCR